MNPVQVPTDTLTILPTSKVVKEVITALKEMAGQVGSEQVAVEKMLKIKTALETDHEQFMELFIENMGIYNLQECLRSPHNKVV